VKKGKNISASVRARLLNLSRSHGEDFQMVLTRYLIERFLYRLSKSRHSDRFIVKGAVLFALWLPGELFHRSTKDLDLLGHGDFKEQQLRDIVIDICRTEVTDDGLDFDISSVKVDPIRIDDYHGGFRVIAKASLAGAALSLQVDVGLGDDVYPDPDPVSFPTLLEQPPAEVLVYRKETVISEKFHTLVDKGLSNSRMKDFFDIRFLARNFSFEAETLGKAIASTFERRRTSLPTEVPIALTTAFSAEARAVQWKAFLRKSDLPAEPLAPVIEEIANFLWPLCQQLHQEDPCSLRWLPGGPWR